MSKQPSTKYVGFRLKIEEYEKFAAKAEQANMTLTEYLRIAILENQSVVVAKQPKASVDKRALQYLFNKTSNNMNQLAHMANSKNKGGVLNDKTFDRILAALIVIRDQLKGGMARVD
ncbi:MAG: plasmid mobilization protein [Plesiomonas shigelloides]